MKRAFVSSLATLTLGITGGVIGTQLIPAGHAATNPLQSQPAAAQEIKVSLPAANDGIADLVDKVKLAVVNIDTVSHRRAPVDQMELFRYYFGDQAPQGAPEQVQKGVGSGFVVRQDGMIATNYHVVKGAEQLTVTLANGSRYTGKVIGTDPGTDLALVKIEAKDLPALKLAEPKSLRVGQYVVALGSPLGLQQTVTAGILSAINRDIALNARVGFLQTDAPINPGNSGGPLLNLKGEVIGVNTAIAARGQGIGFAIPVDTLQTVIPQLEAAGKVERAWLGVGVTNLPEDKSSMFYPADYGVLVGRVEKGSPAEKAGIKSGDVLLSLNGTKLESSAALIREVSKLPVGQSVELVVSRQGQNKTLSLTLAKMPDKLADATAPQAPEGEDEGN